MNKYIFLIDKKCISLYEILEETGLEEEVLLYLLKSNFVIKTLKGKRITYRRNNLYTK